MRNLNWHPDAWTEYLEIQKDRTALKRVNNLLKDLQRNGTNCSLGKLELLKGNYSGYMSIRVDKKNRIIFKADDNSVYIVGCCGHYGDK